MKKDIKAGSGLTVGVDLGDRWSRYCVLDEQGQVLEEDTIATTAQALRKLFSARPGARVDFKFFNKGRRINVYLIRRPCPFTRITSQFHGLWPDTPGRNWAPVSTA